MNFGTNETQHKTATATAVQTPIDRRPSFIIAQHVVKITKKQRTIACPYITETQCIQIKRIFPYVSRQENGGGLQNLGPRDITRLDTEMVKEVERFDRENGLDGEDEKVKKRIKIKKKEEKWNAYKRQ